MKVFGILLGNTRNGQLFRLTRGLRKKSISVIGRARDQMSSSWLFNQKNSKKYHCVKLSSRHGIF
jgi:hypothetical protein